MLNWGNRFNICCFLDNHQYNFPPHAVECLLAAGAMQSLTANAGNALQQLRDFPQNDWLFGHLGYDLKNEIENLSSANPDHIQLPDLFFFIPEYVIRLTNEAIIIGSHNDDHEKVLAGILEAVSPSAAHLKTGTIHTRYTRDEYIDTVNTLRQHILRGDCYEVNLCQEFYAEDTVIDTLQLYQALSHSSPNPFAAYYKWHDRYLLCFSPERYLKKEGSHIISQPMKGTYRRTPNDPEQDARNIALLKNNSKERAENIMVVDLVRNDLSRICREGTVQVDELCEVYSFPQVHQMISTVSGELQADMTIDQIIRASFPMGSMTGAPKKKVMELIERYERTRRGLFSGSVGYIDPEGNFDFNVVIRSALYHATDRYLSFQTGSAITYSSDAAAEYEECLLKAVAIKKALAEANTLH